MARYEEHLRRRGAEVATYPGIASSLEALRGRVRLGVFTAADTSAATLLLTETDLMPYFDVVIGADRARRPKPMPDGLLMACEELGVAPTRTAYVGDGPADMLVARACGALALAAGWGHQLVPDRAADRIVRHPGELLEVLEAGWA